MIDSRLLVMPLRRARRNSLHTLILSSALLFSATAAFAAGPPLEPSPWVATWGTAMVPLRDSAPDISGQTLRLILHTSVGGSKVRVWLSNRYGATPLHIGAAHIAVSADANPAAGTDMSVIQDGTDRVLTFNHQTSVNIAPGSTLVSDGIALDVPALSNLSVSLYFPDHTLGATAHGGAQQISYAATGDMTAAANLAGKSWTKGSWYILSGVDVFAPGKSAIVVMGDSITDGNHSTQSTNRRWPDALAARLAANAATRDAGVLGMVNVGISGSRLLLDGDGPSTMARLDWDILLRSNVHYLILFQGINDLESAQRDHQAFPQLLSDLEAGLAQVAQQAHDHGMRVIGATQMTDSRDFKVAWPEREAARVALNQWILSSSVFDSTIDFDKTMRDPQCPTQMLKAYDSGDAVHPNDTGYKAMADSIDLSLFTK